MTGFLDFGRDRRISAVSGSIGPECRSASVALLGSDYPGLRPDFRVEVGDKVSAGHVLFTDRRRPEISFVAPVGGAVEEISRGAGRVLSSIVMRVDSALRSPPDAASVVATDSPTARALLLARGMWPAFRARPFGRIPAPDARADAIFVNAMASFDGAPDPNDVLSRQLAWFEGGLRMLALLTDGPVFVCLAKGSTVLLPDHERIRPSYFARTSRTALSSHHIAHLMPTRGECTCWTIGWQDVTAIGGLIETGQYQGTRIIAVHGPHGTAPKLVPTVLGAKLGDLFSAGADLVQSGHAAGRILSGPQIGGREEVWLGRYDTQATLVARQDDSALASFLARLLPARKSVRSPILPTAALDRALPIDVPVLPLLRALAVGDLEVAERLGCRGLVEEDMARVSQVCTSGSDYGKLLRRCLDEMEDAA